MTEVVSLGLHLLTVLAAAGAAYGAIRADIRHLVVGVAEAKAAAKAAHQRIDRLLEH